VLAVKDKLGGDVFKTDWTGGW